MTYQIWSYLSAGSFKGYFEQARAGCGAHDRSHRNRIQEPALLQEGGLPTPSRGDHGPRAGCHFTGALPQLQVDLLVVLLAAAIHDIAHPGTNNEP